MSNTVKLYQMWRETDRFLDSLAQSVREGKRVTEASNFARWLLFSGLLSFLQENKDPQSSLPFDPDALRKKADKLIYECGELFRGGKHDPKYAASDIAEINRKLDLLLSGSAGRSSDEPVALRLPEQNESGLCERVIQFIPDGLPTGGRPVDNGKSYEAHSRLASC